MNRRLVSIGLTVAAILLLAGVAGLAYSQWTQPIVVADRALEEGQFEKALASYATAEARFDRFPAAKQLFLSDYTRTVANQLWVLYTLHRYDDTIEKAETAPDGAIPHFWSGCAFFAKARVETEPQAGLELLSRAEEELRRAVEAAPDDWDTKFNFELATRLAEALRSDPKTPPELLMKLIRPRAQAGARPARRVG